MKTLDYVIQNYKSEAFDGRDTSRLIAFVPENKLRKLGITLKEEFVGKHIPKDWTKENILIQLKWDVEFGFEKALNHRGLSSASMYSVVQMWNWILEDGLENFKDYAQYGLPLFKVTALKYGFENPIGDNVGNELQYEEL